MARRGDLAFTIMLAVTAAWALLIGASVVQDLANPDPQARIWLLDVDAERSVYTWFSELLLAGASALLFLTGVNLRSRRAVAIQWLVLAAAFLFLSAEEALGLHGKLSEKLGENDDLGGYFHFAWVIPAIVACAVALVASIPFLRSLPLKTAFWFLVAGAVFVSGAVGLEMIGAKAAFDHGGAVSSVGYRMAANAEEALEGLGVIIFLYAILGYRRRPEFREATAPAFA